VIRKHAAPVVVLALGAIGLAVGAVWVHSIPEYACDEGISQHGWVSVGLVSFALCLPIAFLIRALTVYGNPRLQRLFVAVALAEGVASVLLAITLSGKYGHYRCG
jgi:hypothetical protein